MNAIFKKLNYKDLNCMYVLNAPQAFEPALAEMRKITDVRGSLVGAKDASFLLAFVTKQAEVDKLAEQAGRVLAGEAILWIAYPKGSSKTYQSELNRDSGWSAIGSKGFEPVRMAAIDLDWSAVRFRRVEYIKTMRRGTEFAISRAGKARTKTTPPG
jgi:hypothetical protein